MIALVHFVASLAVLAPDPSGLRGEVRLPDGRPAARARVVLGEIGHATVCFNTPREMYVVTPGLEPAERARWCAELATDAQGRFAIDGLEPGEYTLVAGDDAALAVEPLTVAAGATVRVDLRPSARIEGTIDGVPLDPTRDLLLLEPRSAHRNVSFVPRLEQDQGAWAFRSTALPASIEWRLQGSHLVLEQDYRAEIFSIPVDVRPGETTRVERSLTGGSQLAGDLRGPDGEPLRDVSIVAESAGLRIGAVTDARGRFVVNGLAPGRWHVAARRWTLRELVGCGNGPLDLALDTDLEVGHDAPLALRLERFVATPRIGERAPDFRATTIAGTPIGLSDLRGKVVLIDFWATWCGMCRADLPRLLASYERLAKDGRFEIVGVSVDDDPELVRRFVASRAMRWPSTALGRAADNSIARLYNVHSTPATVLVDAAGNVAALNVTGAELEKRIDELLARR